MKNVARRSRKSQTITYKGHDLKRAPTIDIRLTEKIKSNVDFEQILEDPYIKQFLKTDKK